jgi:hypothetical protein
MMHFEHWGGVENGSRYDSSGPTGLSFASVDVEMTDAYKYSARACRYASLIFSPDWRCDGVEEREKLGAMWYAFIRSCSRTYTQRLLVVHIQLI